MTTLPNRATVLALSLTGMLTQLVLADLESAQISKKENIVSISAKGSKARSAKVNDVVTLQNILRTGRRSRAEIKYKDSSVTRIGSNTVFTINKKKRAINLKRGAILLQLKKNSKKTTIRSGTVNATIRGTTVVMEKDEETGIIRYILLEGQTSIDLGIDHGKGGSKDGDQVLNAGEMITYNPKTGEVRIETIDVAAFILNSSLTDSDFFGELPNGAGAAIADVIESQKGNPNLTVLTSPPGAPAALGNVLNFPTGGTGPTAGGPGGNIILPPGGGASTNTPPTIIPPTSVSPF